MEIEQPATMDRLFFLTIQELARALRRDERTVRDWLSGKQRVPWWVPGIMRLKRPEAELRHYQMGMGKLPPRLGIVSADVIALAQPDEKKPQEAPRLVDAPVVASA